jgi:amidase
LIERANQFTATRADGAGPNPSRWALFKREIESGPMEDYRYTSVRDHGLPLVRAAVEGIISSQQLDALVYPTSSRRPGLIADPSVASAASPSALLGAMGLGSTNIANLTGFPDLIVPAGFTGDHLPVALSFLGPAFSESKLLALGYSFEQATKARRLPKHTPGLAGEVIPTP